MLFWLIAIAVLVSLWGAMWNSYPKMAIGALIGMPIGWLFSKLVSSYLAGDMHEIPLWLPPLPFTLVAVLLLVVGASIWFRADDKS
jgi:hypothetical protein